MEFDHLIDENSIEGELISDVSAVPWPCRIGSQILGSRPDGSLVGRCKDPGSASSFLVLFLGS